VCSSYAAAAVVFGGRIKPTMYKACCGAAPNRINRWRLVSDVRPAVARQIAKLRKPIRECLFLPPCDVFRECSCHMGFPLFAIAKIENTCYIYFTSHTIAIGFLTMTKLPAKKAIKERRDAPIAFRIKPSLKNALEAAAEADRRSVSAMVEILLEESLKERGYLK